VSHAPKQAALEAHAADLLSPQGRARIERHLATCPVCRQTLTAIHAYAALREDAVQQPLPELSWERMDKALDQPLPVPAAPVSGTGRLVALAWPVLAVAATVLIAWIGMSGGPEPTPQLAVKERPSVVPAPAEAALVGHVTLVAGHVFLDRLGQRTPVTLGSAIDEHAVLVTEPGAQLHVALKDQTGFVLGSDSRLHVAELRPQGVHLELVMGTVFSGVRRLDDAQRFSVATVDYSAHVRGTRFLVEKRDGMRVFVHEGKVEVTHKGKLVATLLPGQSFEAPRRTLLAPADAQVHALSGADGAALQLAAVPGVRAWLVDGSAVSAQGGLAMRLPPGPTRLSFQDLHGQLRTLDLTLDELGTTLDEVALTKLVAPAERSGHLEPDQISAVVRAGLDPLRRCYERSLKMTPELVGKLTLRMRVAADGRVLRAEAKGTSELPADLQRCLAQAAGRFQFPRPEGGEGLSFEVPLNLKSGR